MERMRRMRGVNERRRGRVEEDKLGEGWGGWRG